jgi:hypothetical protein
MVKVRIGGGKLILDLNLGETSPWSVQCNPGVFNATNNRKCLTIQHFYVFFSLSFTPLIASIGHKTEGMRLVSET